MQRADIFFLSFFEKELLQIILGNRNLRKTSSEFFKIFKSLLNPDNIHSEDLKIINQSAGIDLETTLKLLMKIICELDIFEKNEKE